MTGMPMLFLLGGLAALGTAILTFPVRTQLERLGVVDIPNVRSSHSRVTVRGGGLAMVGIIVALIACLAVTQRDWELTVLIAAVLVLSTVSMADDIRSISPVVRILVHSTCAILAVGTFGLKELEIAVNPGFSVNVPSAIVLLIQFLWVVGYTNAFNFMDGINGIAAGQAAVAGLGTAAFMSLYGNAGTSAVIGAIVGGAALGFLPHNFPRARVFMGDVGSATLGYLLATDLILACRDSGWFVLLPLFMLHVNFVLDTGITMLRRWWRGEQIWKAHREHFYQRLVRTGKSHTFTTGSVLLIQCLILVILLNYPSFERHDRIIVLSGITGLWLVLFCLIEWYFRRWQAKGSSKNERLLVATKNTKDMQ
jgi:UDP-N-acetylmuramyl pentapeptide phosphotransferase/UDP-N-acetylglucosamine-1-phosphate transferase